MSFVRSVVLVVEVVALVATSWAIQQTYKKLAVSVPPVFLIATPSNVYTIGQPVPITASLQMPQTGIVSASSKICTLGLTTVTIGSITLNGVEVRPDHGISDFITDPRLLQNSSIQTIRSGGAAPIGLMTGTDVDGYTFLADVYTKGPYWLVIGRGPGDFLDLSVPEHDTRIYKLDRPGVYKIQLRYHYEPEFASSEEVFSQYLYSNVLSVEIK